MADTAAKEACKPAEIGQAEELERAASVALFNRRYGESQFSYKQIASMIICAQFLRKEAAEDEPTPTQEKETGA